MENLKIDVGYIEGSREYSRICCGELMQEFKDYCKCKTCGSIRYINNNRNIKQ